MQNIAIVRQDRKTAATLDHHVAMLRHCLHNLVEHGHRFRRGDLGAVLGFPKKPTGFHTPIEINHAVLSEHIVDFILA